MNNNLSIVGASRDNGLREKDDFYPTPIYATQSLLDKVQFSGSVWECACGDGAMSDVIINNGYDVYSSDLIERGYGDKLNFLTSNKKVDNIITNPPYKDALAFLNKAKESSHNKIAFLLKTVFLERVGRYDMFMDTEFPLKTVYQFSKRISFSKNNTNYTNYTNGGMIAFAWFVWDKNHVGKPTMEWIK
jgi:hypothetical protein